MLDGEGGYCVWGKLMPAADSLTAGGLPIGLAHGVTLTRPVKAGQAVTFADVAATPGSNSDWDEAHRVRRQMEEAYAAPAAAAS